MAKNKIVRHTCDCGREHVFNTKTLELYDNRYTCRDCGAENFPLEGKSKKGKKPQKKEEPGKMRGQNRKRRKDGALRKKRADTGKPRKKKRE